MRPFGKAIRPIWRCCLGVLVLCGALSPARIGAQRLQAPKIAAPETDPSIRIVPLQSDRSAPAATTSVATNMTYHGGPVQHNQKIYTIFWNATGTPFAANYQTTINQFIQDLSGSALQSLATQYTDGAGHISTTVTLGGTWLDTTNALANNPVLQSDLLAEVGRAKTANPSWTDDANTYYQIFTPPGNGTTTGYCGYHVPTNPAYGVILYPAAHTSGTCLIGGTYPNSAQIDSAINTTSHEILETVTDPVGTGWYYLNGGGEIGDLCNFTFGTRGIDGSNMTMNGHPYLAQQEWSNVVSGCSLAAAGVVAGSGSLVSESIPNGWLDPGEAVSVSLCMNNFNPATSGSITGTLQATGGVTSPSGAQSYGTIAAFGNTCHTYSFTVGSSCGTRVTATLQDAESGGPTQDLTYTFQVGGPGSTFSSQNFDGVVAPALPAGWTTSTLSGTANLWVTNGAASDSAPNHAVAADPSTVSDNVLVSPSIAIPAGGGQVSFRHSFNLDFDSGGYYDGGVLEISIGGGSFADIITAGGSFVAGGYNNVLFVGSSNPIGGRGAWAGNSGGYITSTISLPASAAGQNIQLRWRLTTDSSVAFTGWSLDTITLNWFLCGGISPPTIVTQAATSVTATGATLNGTANPNGNSTTALFDYGLTTGYGSQVAAAPAPGAGVSPVAVSAAISGLTCNTLYHFRLAATNSGGPTNGSDLTLTTAACATPPSTVTLAATSITLSGATLNGTVNPNGLSTTALFDYGLTTGYGSQATASPVPGSGVSPVAVSATISGLACGSVYHYRVAGSSSGGTTNGSDLTFTAGSFFSEDFDGVVAPALPAGWTTSTVSGTANLWTTSATSPDSAPNRALATDLSSSSDSVLVSPTIAVPAGNTQLTFRHSYNVESGFDGGVLEIAISGGPFQDIIAAGGTFTAGGYSGTLSSGNPIGARQAWTGNSAGYVTTTVTLPALAAGQNVVLRWRMASDSSVAVSGWSVDSITLYQYLCASSPPTVTTLTATSITATGATLNGTVNPNGTSTTGVFNYGLTTNYGTQAAATPAPGSGVAPVAVSAAVTGLTCNTLYHFRAGATSTGGPNNGVDLTFTTSVCPPTVVTLAATSITANGATLNGTVNPNGTSSTALFDYGLTTGYGSQVTATPAPGSGVSPVAVGGAIGGLICNTLYHFRVAGTNSGGTTNGSDLTLTTGACVGPTVVTLPATSITTTGATLNGTVDPGGLSSTALFDYGLTAGYGSQAVASPVPGSGSSPVAVSAPITGLACGVLYHYRVTGTSSGGTTNGSDLTFTSGTFFSENFDGVVAPALPAGWTTNTLAGTANLWVTNATSADTAPNRAFAADLNSSSDSVLISPTIAIPVGTSRLNFRHLYNVESQFDGAVLEIAVGGSAFQDVIAAGGTFVAGGYNGTVTATGPLNGRQAWTGNSGAYVTTTVTMPPVAAGQDVVLRWRIASDSSFGVTGWSVDSVTLYGFQCDVAAPPTVTTLAATSITATTATLNGTVNPNGTSTTGVFYYGPTANYGSQVAASPVPGSGASPVPVSAAISSLVCNTLYHFRAGATSSGGPNNGVDLTFTTGACPAPTVVTAAATNVTSTAATLNGTVNPNGSSTTALFDYGPTAGYGSQAAASPVPGAGSSPVAVSAVVSNLVCNSTYHFRVVGTNALSTNGFDLTLTTAPCPAPGLVGVVKALAVDPNNVDIVYAGTTNGVYKSVNGGASWNRVDSGLQYTNVTSLAIDPNAPCRIIAGIDSGLTNTHLGPGLIQINNTNGILAESIDCGLNWGIPSGSPDGVATSSLAFTSANPAALYSGIRVNSVLFGSDWVEDKVTRTTWSGGTATTNYSFGFEDAYYAVATDPAGPCTGYAGAFSGTILKNTACSGTMVWSAVGSPLSGKVNTIAAHPTNQSTLLAGTSDGHIYQKLDDVSPWVSVATVTGSINGLLYQPGSALIAYAAGSGGVLYETTDGGGTWAPASTIGSNVSALATSASSAAFVYAGGNSFVLKIAPGGLPAPTVLTQAATSITKTTATLNGTVNPNGTNATAVFDYGLTTGYGSQVAGTPGPGSGVSPASVSGAISGLTCNTLYHFRAAATNSGGPTNGSDLTFTTAGCAPAGNYVQNGTFGSGLTNWQTFATPDASYISAAVSGGVLQFSRVPPPPGTSNQATVFQETGVALPSGVAATAQFDLGNTSNVRKYTKVLLIDSDFSDFAACTFWLPANSSMQTYQLKTHTTKAWTNAAIYFYAGTANAPGDLGAYQVDNVSVQYAPAQATDHTDCIDPLAPMAPGGGAGPNLLTNGDFGTNALPPWTTFGTISAQAPAGVLQMIRPTGTLPAGVVKQQTSSTVIQTMTSGQILTASFQLGNSSGVRKRVTAIMHDNDFSDLVACVFWLEPGQAPSNYSMVGWASKPWTDATLSFYAATIGSDQWTLVDNVVYQRTPGTAVTGSTCNEPGATSVVASPPSLAVAAPPVVGSAALAPASLVPLAHGEMEWISDGGFTQSANGTSWGAVADTPGTTRLTWQDQLDLRQATGAHLTFGSLLSARESQGVVQVSSDGTNWTTVGAVPASDSWQPVDVNLNAFVGDVVHVQLVFDAVAHADAEEPDSWQVDDLAVEVR